MEKHADLLKLYGMGVDPEYLVEIAEARTRRAIEMYPIRVEIAEAKRNLAETYPGVPFPETETPEKHRL